MNEDHIKSFIKQYLKDNLEIHLEINDDHNGWESSRYLKVKLKLDNEVIYTDGAYLS